MKRATLVVTSIASLCCAASALAQDETAAGVLFEQGLADLQAKKYDTACPAIEQSYRLDPRPGTLFTLATCNAEEGKIATAIERYDEYLRAFAALSQLQQLAQKGRDAAATDQRTALIPQVPTLTITTRAGAPAGIVVRRDGVEVRTSALGAPMPIDPGEHTVTVDWVPPPAASEASSKWPAHLEQKVVLALGDKQVVALGPADPPQPPPTPPPPEKKLLDLRWMNKQVGYTTLAAGGGSLLLGTVFGIVAIAKKGDVDGNCTGWECNSAGKAAADDGKAFAAASSVAFGLGIAAAAAGGAIVLLVPQRSASAHASSGWTTRIAVTPAADGASLGLHGRFE